MDFKLLLFCYKGDTNYCYISHVDSSESTLLKDTMIFFYIDIIDIYLTESSSILHSDYVGICGIFV